MHRHVKASTLIFLICSSFIIPAPRARISAPSGGAPRVPRAEGKSSGGSFVPYVAPPAQARRLPSMYSGEGSSVDVVSNTEEQPPLFPDEPKSVGGYLGQLAHRLGGYQSLNREQKKNIKINIDMYVPNFLEKLKEIKEPGERVQFMRRAVYAKYVKLGNKDIPIYVPKEATFGEVVAFWGGVAVMNAAPILMVPATLIPMGYGTYKLGQVAVTSIRNLFRENPKHKLAKQAAYKLTHEDAVYVKRIEEWGEKKKLWQVTYLIAPKKVQKLIFPAYKPDTPLATALIVDEQLVDPQAIDQSKIGIAEECMPSYRLLKPAVQEGLKNIQLSTSTNDKSSGEEKKEETKQPDEPKKPDEQKQPEEKEKDKQPEPLKNDVLIRVPAPLGGGLGNSSSSNGDGDRKDDGKKFVAADVAQGATLVPLQEATQELVRAAGPWAVPIAIGVGIYVGLKNGWKSLWSSGKNGSARNKENAKFALQQQEFIKKTNAVYVTRLERSPDGELEHVTHLIAPSDHPVKEMMYIGAVPADPALYGPNPPIGQVVKGPSELDSIKGFTDAEFVAKAPCKGPAEPPIKPGCGPAPKVATAPTGCGNANPLKPQEPLINIIVAPESIKAKGCGDAKPQNMPLVLKADGAAQGEVNKQDVKPKTSDGKPRVSAISGSDLVTQSAEDGGVIAFELAPLKEGYSQVNLPNPVYKIVKGTGEKCRIVRPLDITKAELEWSPKKYEEIRKWKDDVQRIAKNTGLKEHKIKRIKDHLFYKEHIQVRKNNVLDRFDPDPEIAAAWDRLYRGDFIKNDLQLLEHEYFESKFEGIFKTNYETAHDKTQHPIKGKAWAANLYED